MAYISSKSNTSVISKGKDPKYPKDGNYLDFCRKDFRDFKDKDGPEIIKILSTLVKDMENKGNKPVVLVQQKTSLENVMKLISEGKKNVAFSEFYRTFPTCMPYRSR